MRIRKQAVVIIHGIGEQRPMDTLRSFVNAVVPPGTDGASQYYNKPDEMSGSFELRRLVTVDSRPRTEFYEFYWAHRMPHATWTRIMAWLHLLVFRSKSQIPEQLRGLWWIAWTGISLAAMVFGAASLFALWPALAPEWWPKSGIGFSAIPLLALGLAAAQAFILSYIGDAAIYLSAHPSTVAARQDIRSAGVALIESLHAKGDYDRIVIVGHSLGSVIGYDIIKHLWQRLHESHGSPDRPGNDALKKVESLARMDRNAVQDSKTCAQACHDAVHALWHEQRSQGFPWLVTDFVTLGSPLAHATLLLADNRTRFDRLIRERELPVAPPLPDSGNGIAYHIPYQRSDGAPRSIAALHHAAPFAVTRWTNIYFPCRNVISGDVVGGPISTLFGPAILDVPVNTRRMNGFLSHTFYWPQFPADCGQAGDPLAALKDALKLGLRRERER